MLSLSTDCIINVSCSKFFEEKPEPESTTELRALLLTIASKDTGQ